MSFSPVIATPMTINGIMRGAGQSFTTLMRHGTMGAHFLDLIHAQNGGGFAANRPVFQAQDYGGTSILKRNAPYVGGNWWDEDTGLAGPLLTSALAALDLFTGAPNLGIAIGLGEGDSVHANTPALSDTAALYKTGMLYVAAQLQAQMVAKGGGVASDYPVFIYFIGRRVGGWTNLKGIHIIRQAQIDLVLDNGLLLGCELYDVDLVGGGDSHMSAAGQLLAAKRKANRVLKRFKSGYVGPEGPTVSSVTQLSATQIRINVNVEAGYAITKPTYPAGFRVFTDATLATENPISSFGGWSGNNLTINLTNSAASPPVVVPVWDACKRVDGTDGLAGDFIKYTSTTDAAQHPLKVSRPITATV